MRWSFLFLLALTGCYREQDWHKTPSKRIKKEQCIKIINGRFFHVDDCKYWGHIPSSDSQSILPP